MAETRERTEEQRQRDRERKRDLREARKVLGLCEKCGKRPTENGHVECEVCLERHREYSRKRYRDKTFDDRRVEAEKERKQRQMWIAAGLCSDCGQRPPVNGLKQCEVCLEKERDYYERTKDWKNEQRRSLRNDRKARGICVQCGVRDAVKGKVRCLECLEYMRTSESERRGRMSEEEKREKRRKDMERERKTRELREKAGLCIMCGKRVAQDGYLSCPICRARERLRHRKDGAIPRSEWPDHGLCYICGKRPVGLNPDGEQMRVCVECRKHIMETAVKADASKASHENYARMCRQDFARAFLKRD